MVGCRAANADLSLITGFRTLGGPPEAMGWRVLRRDDDRASPDRSVFGPRHSASAAEYRTPYPQAGLNSGMAGTECRYAVR
jgi:hypothetical protein